MSGVGCLRFGSVRFPGHPEEVDEPFRDTFRGLPLPLTPLLTYWVRGRFGVGGGGREVGAGAAADGVPLTVPGPCGSCGCGD